MDAGRIASALQVHGLGRWDVTAAGASSFCDTWVARQGDRKLFVKSASGASAALLAAEAQGLRALEACHAIRVPRLEVDAEGLLALEWLDLAPPDSGFGARFGRALRSLHDTPPPDVRFGWPHDNFIGATPQANAPHEDWLSFFADQRLRAMARRLGAADIVDAVERVIDAMPRLFGDGHVPRASLVHGDLWQGNWGMLSDGTPVIYDPAVCVADAEYELAMMELFGAFPPGFLTAYGEPAAGYARRRALYQLYHLLNHAVLFGGGYAQQSLRVARSLTARP